MTVLLSRLPVALTTVAVLLCCAAPASADIKPFHSIAGFQPGIEEGKVREQLGEPSSVREGPVVGHRTLIYTRRKLDFTVFESGRVGAITTRSRSHRTSSGLGVGTPLATLRAKLRGEHCNDVRRHTVCSVVRRGMTMDYIVVRGRVTSVSLIGPP